MAIKITEDDVSHWLENPLTTSFTDQYDYATDIMAEIGNTPMTIEQYNQVVKDFTHITAMLHSCLTRVQEAKTEISPRVREGS